MEGKGKVGRRRIEEDTEGNCRGNALRSERERERENTFAGMWQKRKGGRKKQKVESQLTWTQVGREVMRTETR